MSFIIILTACNAKIGIDDTILLYDVSYDGEYGIIKYVHIEGDGSDGKPVLVEEKYYLVDQLNPSEMKWRVLDSLPSGSLNPSLSGLNGVVFIRHDSAKAEIIYKEIESTNLTTTLLSGNYPDLMYFDIIRTYAVLYDSVDTLLFLDQGRSSLLIKLAAENNYEVLRNFGQGGDIYLTPDYCEIIMAGYSVDPYGSIPSKILVYDIEIDSLWTFYKSPNIISNPQRMSQGDKIYYLEKEYKTGAANIFRRDNSGNVEQVTTYIYPYNVESFFLTSCSLVCDISKQIDTNRFETFYENIGLKK
ncbi:MAG: hypothetical protein CVT49_06515 [candidate division Zixibacteria bacterium HGW-Zixibacteria-1]|nr:MAG: hypothetical protein CVT49_06515 [candidate division Zixibacteria bacterium HGW-Zixibacteria-1]